jgi:integrase
MKALTAEELTRLLDSTQDDRLHALWVVLGTTGMRLGEALGLGWVDVQLDDRRLFVRRGLQRRRGGGYVFVEPKTVASRRMVMLSQLAVEALHRHQARQRAEQESADRWCDWGLVFCRGEGGPVDGSRILIQLHRALAIAGLPTMRVHDLRHTAATILLTAGIHPKVVQEMLGHSTIGATLDIYSHVAPALHSEAAAHFDSVLAAASSTQMSGVGWP